MAHRGRLLEFDTDTAARGVSEGLLGLAELQSTVCCSASCGGEVARGEEMGAGARATHPSDRRTRRTK